MPIDPVEDDIRRTLQKGQLFQQRLQAEHKLKGRTVKAMTSSKDELQQLFQHSSWQKSKQIS